MITRITQSCSWCDTLNGVTKVATLSVREPVYCSECGHLADAPRMACDCWQCGALDLAYVKAVGNLSFERRERD